jgi:hypothetical protein
VDAPRTGGRRTGARDRRRGDGPVGAQTRRRRCDLHGRERCRWSTRSWACSRRGSCRAS